MIRIEGTIRFVEVPNGFNDTFSLNGTRYWGVIIGNEPINANSLLLDTRRYMYMHANRAPNHQDCIGPVLIRHSHFRNLNLPVHASTGAIQHGEHIVLHVYKANEQQLDKNEVEDHHIDSIQALQGVVFNPALVPAGDVAEEGPAEDDDIEDEEEVEEMIDDEDDVWQDEEDEDMDNEDMDNDDDIGF